MHEVATISFRDAESRDQGTVIIRQLAGTIGFCLSLEKNGDIEVFLSQDDCRKIADSLCEAIKASHSEQK
jgi:hypothetical protein